MRNGRQASANSDGAGVWLSWLNSSWSAGDPGWESAVAFEVSAQLAESEVSHALIEGDVLDFAYPPPEGPQLAEKNLATLWSNYGTSDTGA